MTVKRLSLLEDEYDKYDAEDYSNTDVEDDLDVCIMRGCPLESYEDGVFDAEGDGPFCIECFTDHEFEKDFNKQEGLDEDWPV